MESLQVCDYMNHHPVKLTKNMPVAEAVERLLQRQQSGGPVLDEAGKLCGFLSEQDCIKAMVESTYYREQVCRVDRKSVGEGRSVVGGGGVGGGGSMRKDKRNVCERRHTNDLARALTNLDQ